MSRTGGQGRHLQPDQGTDPAASRSAAPGVARATEIGRLVIGLGAGWTGVVHSSFATSVNVAGHVEGRQSWVTLRPRGSPLPPFGLACEPWPEKAVAAGTPATVIGQTLIVKGWLRITWAEAEVRGGEVLSPAPLPDIASALSSARAMSRSDFLGALATVLFGGEPSSSKLGCRAEALLTRLEIATRGSAHSEIISVASALVGLGPGLTPAGDDVLCGWITGLRAAGAEGRRTLEAVGPRVIQALDVGTNEISRAYGHAAFSGAVAEPLRAFIVDPGTESLPGVLALGATSGGDWLAGYLLARHALQ